MRQKTLGYKPNESTEAFKKRKANETFAKKQPKLQVLEVKQL